MGTRTGALISHLNADAEVVENSLSTNVSMFLRSGVSILASIIIIFVLQPVLAATFMVGFLPILFFSIKFGQVMKDNAKAVSSEKAKMSSIAEESIGNVRIVKAFANETREMREFGKFSDQVYKIGI